MSNEHFLGKVSTLAFGGSGIVKNEGLAIFCPFTIPGEKIEGKITDTKKNYAVGELTRILEPSKFRIEPRCPHFGVCGGCQLQHMNLETQLEWKRNWVKEALERVGGFEDVRVANVLPSNPWTYRRHISLTLMPHGNHYRAGYIAQDGRHFIETEVCPIFIEEDHSLLRQVQAIAKELNCTGRERGKLSLLKTKNEQFNLEFHFKNLPSNAEAVLKAYLGAKDSHIKGILCRSPGKTLKLGDLSQNFEIEGLEIAYSSSAFVQAHPDQSAEIYTEIAKFIQNSHFSTLLDLYSGIGITSLILGRYIKNVTSIELNSDAVKLAKQNCRVNKLKNIKFIEGRVEEELPKLEDDFDVVLLNPPREGAGIKMMELIARHQPKMVVYISCMPPTLARDLKILRDKGYRIKECLPFDMFPQTTHVETLVLLEKS